ncbi:unnamed protein product, partial [marine sediment metagenome]
IDKKLIYRKRKKGNDVKKYTRTVNPDLKGQQTQKGYFKEAINEWTKAGYSSFDIQAWNVYARSKKVTASGFNMFTRLKINADIESKTWERLTNCNIYNVKGKGFKVDINVDGDYLGKLYIGTSKYSMLKEVPGVFSVDKYTFDITGLSLLTRYYFYIENTAIGKEGRTGIYSQKTTEYMPVPIDIGLPAIDRSYYLKEGWTRFNKSNPANATGRIKRIEIYAYNNLLNVKVATFYQVSEYNYSTRDWTTIGNVPAGSKQIFEVDIEVKEGDFLGMYWSNGYMEADTSGYAGIKQIAGDHIPCENEAVSTLINRGMSEYGIGEG